jgi:hypothetical protein
MGNYESLHVDIGVEDSVRSDENVNGTFDRIYTYVEKKLLDKVNELEAELNDATSTNK